MRTPSIVLAGVVVVALVTACGGEGEDNGAEGAAKRSLEADAQQRAEDVLLQLSDFPDGWRATSPEEDEDSGNEFRACIGADFSEVTITGEAESDDFAMGESSEASSDATVLGTEAEATAALEALGSGMQSASVGDCLQRLIQESADAEVSVGDVDVGQLGFTPPPGLDEARAWQIPIPVEIESGEGEGLSATVYVDIVELREGNTVARVLTSDVLSPFDSELRDQLVAVVAGRLTE